MTCTNNRATNDMGITSVIICIIPLILHSIHYNIDDKYNLTMYYHIYILLVKIHTIYMIMNS